MAAPRLLFYVTGHGYGHATRVRALIAALIARTGGDIALHVRTDAPHWIFTERDDGVDCSAAHVDVGVLQRSGMDVDLPATLVAHEALVSDWARSVEREARFIDSLSPDVVVADVPPLAFAAAARAGVPAFGLANFGWDWVAAQYAENEPRWHPVAALYREAYAGADRLFRLPLHADLSAFPRIDDIPFLVNRSLASRADCRERIGVSRDDPRRLVLVSFGGFRAGPLPAGNDDSEGGADARFVVVGDEPTGASGDWIALPHPAPLPHEDLMHACDAVIGKTGYGTVAEALAHGVRFLYLPRDGFPETPILEAGVEARGCAHPMPREDFESGRWRPHLDALFALPAPTALPESETDGAAIIADTLLGARR